MRLSIYVCVRVVEGYLGKKLRLGAGGEGEGGKNVRGGGWGWQCIVCVLYKKHFESGCDFPCVGISSDLFLVEVGCVSHMFSFVLDT